jgi:anti-sigma regulatory factor (Ser/Thr protein kinase)
MRGGQTGQVIKFRQEWSATAHPATVRELRHSVSTAAEAVGFSDSALHDIRICVSEAVTNAVVHAFPGGHGPGTIAVRVELQADELLIVVRDDGIGLKPRGSPGLGLGLPTIAALADSMTIAASADAGTEISMGFAR